MTTSNSTIEETKSEEEYTPLPTGIVTISTNVLSDDDRDHYTERKAKITRVNPERDILLQLAIFQFAGWNFLCKQMFPRRDGRAFYADIILDDPDQGMLYFNVLEQPRLASRIASEQFEDYYPDPILPSLPLPLRANVPLHVD